MTYWVLFLPNLNLQFYSTGYCPAGEKCPEFILFKVSCVQVLVSALEWLPLPGPVLLVELVLRHPLLLGSLHLPTDTTKYTTPYAPPHSHRLHCLPALGAASSMFKEVSLSLLKSSL